MGSAESLLAALDERRIAERVGIPHDQARISYPLRSNTVSSFNEFDDLLADYCNHHSAACIGRGGVLFRADAAGKAKEILEQEYRRQGGGLVSAYNDAHDGTNGGMRLILDRIAEGLKAEAVRHYMREIFDRHVSPNSWEQKVAIIREFIANCGVHLASAIRSDQPERYAHDYEELIRSYVAALQRTSSVFRRL